MITQKLPALASLPWRLPPSLLFPIWHAGAQAKWRKEASRGKLRNVTAKYGGPPSASDSLASHFSAREAAGRAADAQKELKAAQQKLDDLKEASKASGSPVNPEKASAAQQELDTARARAAEANHDKALAGFNGSAALVAFGTSLLRGKLGSAVSKTAGIGGLAINAVDTVAQYAQYAGWTENPAEEVARRVDEQSESLAGLKSARASVLPS
jgi:hypothetical protein